MLHKRVLDKIKPYKPGKPIEELRRQKKLTKIYKLASNEIPFVPGHIKKAVNQGLKQVNRYPESSCFYLRKKLAKRLKIPLASIVFGNGSDEIITLALKAFIEPGDEVIVSYPSFLIYDIQAQIFGAKVTRVPLNNYSYDLDAIRTKISSKTKIIFIANPDNPTGTYLNHKQVEGFLKKVPKHVILFFDEAYFEFAPKDFPKSIELLKQHKNIIITRTFSKAYGLAGLRVGYGVTSLGISEVLNKAREPFNTNSLAQLAAQAALEDKAFVKKVVAFINKEKRYFYKNFDQLGLFYLKSSTNFILVKFGKNTKDFYEYLLNQGVIIRDLRSWGLDDFFRVTIGTPVQNKKFISLLKQYQRRKGR